MGIGTTTPTQSLHVQGNVRITGALYASDISGISTSGSSGQILQSVGTGISWVNASTAGVGGGSTISISTNTTNQSQYLTYVTGTGNTTGFGVSTTGLVFNPSTGNLGLGTSIPSARLSVANPNTGNSLLLVNDNLSEGSLFRVSNSAGNMLVDVDSGGTILFPTSGNVGIGTTLFSPTTKLHVDGDVTAKFYYGDGSNLKNLGLGGIGITNTTSQSTPVYPTLAANTTSGITTIGIATTGLSFITSTNTLQVGIAVTPIVMYGNTGVISATSYYGDGSNLKFPTIALAGTTGQVLYNNSGQIAAAANLNYNTATGNVGIGTTIATARLSVSSPTSGNSLLLVNDNLSDGSLFRVSNSAGQVLADVDSSGTILFPTSGNVGIGTTLSSPTTKLHVQGDVRITGALYDNNNNVGAASSVLTATAGGGIVWAAVGGATLNNTPSGTVYPVSAASTTGSLSTAYTSSTAFTFTTSTGTLSATQFTSLSDVNKKKNIRPIENAIDITKKLEGVRFDWIDTGAPSIGVIAQEVEKVLPELVEETDGVKSVSYGNIIGVLIEAIKEQQVRIEELERRI